MQANKKIGISILVAALLLQGFFIYKRVHNYPFMIYDMYSRPEIQKEYSTQFLIIADQDTINPIALPIMKEGVLINSLKQYQSQINIGEASWESALRSRQERLGNTFTNRTNKYLKASDSEIKAYPTWLRKYIEKQVVRQKISQLKVYAITIETRFGLEYKEELLIDIND